MSNPRIMWIAWPAFLSACVLELVVFAMVDPHDVHWAGQALSLSRQGVYTAGFFVFWAIGAGACALTALLGMPASQVNGAALPVQDPPGS